MKEICHKGLAKLIGEWGTIRIDKELISELINASIKPDLENRRFIENNIEDPQKIIPILLKWLINHTIGAKELAIKNLKSAFNAYLNNDPSWISSLGISFHYITDWGTPYHSPVSLANPVIRSILIGVIGLGGLKLLINWIGGSKKLLNGVMKWISIGAGVSGGISLITLYLEHKNFEEKCDKLWDYNEKLIIKKFLGRKKNLQMPYSFGEALELFEEKMNGLRIKCNKVSPYWILSNNGRNFANYMIQIANVMDFTVQIINYY